MRAAMTAIEAGALDARVRLVVSNRRDAPALSFARAHGAPTLCIPTLADPEAADRRLAHALRAARVEWVVLSGYLRKLGPRTLAAFAGRILNIHPGLLPRHGGPGMYGRRVHDAVIAAGDTITGASVHLVDDEYDHGEVLAQARVPVALGDTAETLERKVTAIEPQLLLSTLRDVAGNARRA